MLFLEERGKPQYPRKTSRCRVENQQTQTTYHADSAIKPGPHWWEASVLTITPPLHLVMNFIFTIIISGLSYLAGLWGLINNAGIAKIGPVEWQSLEDYKRVADVNLWGLIDVTKVFLPLIKKECGRIINIASIAGK